MEVVTRGAGAAGLGRLDPLDRAAPARRARLLNAYRARPRFRCVIECAVAGGYGGDTSAADAVTAWIAETLRRGVPNGSRRAAVPRAPGRTTQSQHGQRRLMCRWL